MNNQWFTRMIALADSVAGWSKDPSTKVGCILVEPNSMTVVSMGFNGFPRGVREREQIEVEAFHGRLQLVQTNTLDPVRWARPLKYQFVEHAERNAIFNAARIGVKTEGCWAFMNFMPTPCADCARALIQAGIVKIIGSDRPFPGVGAGVHYHIDETSKQMLKEGGVETLTVPTR